MLNRILNRGEASGNRTEPAIANPVDVVSPAGWVPPSSQSVNHSGAASIDPTVGGDSSSRSVQREVGGDDSVVISTVDALPLFTRKMYDDDLVQMPPSMRQCVCPVEVSPPNAEGKKRGEYAIILTKDMRNDDYVEELVAHLRASDLVQRRLVQLRQRGWAVLVLLIPLVPGRGGPIMVGGGDLAITRTTAPHVAPGAQHR